MATFSRIAGAEPSTITFKARTVQHTQNSSAMQQEIVSLGDPENANSVARVSSVAPASSDAALVVRTVGNSTVLQGTSPWVISGNSTVVQGTSPWIIAGNSTVVVLGTVVTSGDSTCVQGTSPWVVSPNSTGFVKAMGLSVDSSNVLNVKVDGSTALTIGSIAAGAGRLNIGSTAADNVVTVGAFTPARLNIGSTAADNAVLATIGTNLQSTTAPSSASSGLIVRQVWDDRLAFASTSALASTSLAVNSSVASMRAYVTAYSITSTTQVPAQWGFWSSNANLLWPVTMAAISSAFCGVNLSGYPYLFHTNVGEALNFKTQGSTVSLVQLGVSYYMAP